MSGIAAKALATTAAAGEDVASVAVSVVVLSVHACVKPAVAPRPDGHASVAKRQHVERLLRFYLAMRRRHRVESYGLARKRKGEDALEGDEAQGAGRPCPDCGKCMTPRRGWRWERAGRGMRVTSVREVIREREYEAWKRGGAPRPSGQNRALPTALVNKARSSSSSLLPHWLLADSALVVVLLPARSAGCSSGLAPVTVELVPMGL